MTNFQQGFAAGVETAALESDKFRAPYAERDFSRGQHSAAHNIGLAIRALRPSATVPTPDPGFTAGIEAMRAALVEYFRVWPRDDMTADLISKFDVPARFLWHTAAPAPARTRGIGPFTTGEGMKDETSYHMRGKWICSACGRVNSMDRDNTCPRCLEQALEKDRVVIDSIAKVGTK